MFRPCIDLHEGKVKQIVGGTLSDAPGQLRTNFISDRAASWFAELYRRDGLKGGHVIMLGAGNEEAARSALAAFPGGMHVGGGINAANARDWLDAGASHVIVTSWVFREGRMDEQRLAELVKIVGKQRLVLDLSCRKHFKGTSLEISVPPLHEPYAPPHPGPLLDFAEEREEASQRSANSESKCAEYLVVTDRWQKFTNLAIKRETLGNLAKFCAEFLVHAVDVEGLCRGIDKDLVSLLGEGSPIPTTYAGGASSLADLEEVTRLGRGRIDLTIGSALDIFGGSGVRYEDVVTFNRKLAKENQ